MSTERQRTKLESIAFTNVNVDFSYSELRPHNRPLAPPPCVPCEATSDGVAFGYEGTADGDTCGVVTIAPAPATEQPSYETAHDRVCGATRDHGAAGCWFPGCGC
ncbi:hypothetical protein CYMTET_14511 [Cymbomonas tetramitiformis]|uniref:Uncharacterized protein n=1 Tax=Cymbomonas tetramitiformis TaxID=36881 RepID=A0AAE0GFY3_9CHLO|nr:hypothetical protein CYMTET_14511 [Cymbomonas tetramitiformis]